MNIDNTLEFGETRFVINKLLPLEAKHLFVHNVRPLLKGLSELKLNEDGTSFENTTEAIISAFTDAPAEHYDVISHVMAKAIQATRGKETRFLHQTGAKEWAFQGLEGAHAMLVDVRAFTINFIGWLDVIKLEFPQIASLQETFNSPTSTPSSETSSELTRDSA